MLPPFPPVQVWSDRRGGKKTKRTRTFSSTGIAKYFRCESRKKQILCWKQHWPVPIHWQRIRCCCCCCLSLLLLIYIFITSEYSMPFISILCNKDCSNKSFPHTHYFIHITPYTVANTFSTLFNRPTFEYKYFKSHRAKCIMVGFGLACCWETRRRNWVNQACGQPSERVQDKAKWIYINTKQRWQSLL